MRTLLDDVKFKVRYTDKDKKKGNDSIEILVKSKGYNIVIREDGTVNVSENVINT